MRTEVPLEDGGARPHADEPHSAHAAPNWIDAHPLIEWGVAGFFVIVLLAQLLSSVHRLSQTADESTHLYAGYRALQCGDFGFGAEHPPLAKMTAATPLVAMDIPVDCEFVQPHHEAFASLNWLYGQDWTAALFRARAAVSIFSVALCVVVWLTARQMFGFTTALVATLLLVFDPNLLANGALVTTDVVVSFTFLLSIYGFYLLQTRRHSGYLVLTGLATGLTLVSKHSGIIVIPLLLLLAIADIWIDGRKQFTWRQTALHHAWQLGLVFAIAVLTIWSAYGWRYTARPDGQPLSRTTSQDPQQQGRALQRLLAGANTAHILPEAYLAGLSEATGLAEQQTPTFIAGRIYPHGQWFFYPLVILVKYTAPFLVLLLMGALGFRWKEHRRELAYLLIPAGAFLAVCMRARMNSGVRHILPILPFLVVFVAAGCVKLAGRVRWARYALACLVVLHVASSLHAFPHYLSYANELVGGPGKAYKYLPWVDWGQSYSEVNAYVEQHSAQPCWIATDYLMDPRLYGVPCQPFGARFVDDVPARMQGTVFVSSASLSSPRGTLDGLLPLFSQVTPKARIGGSAMLVYEGNFDTTILAAAAENQLAVKSIVGRQPDAAMFHARKAFALAPNTFWAHDALCAALLVNGETQQAQQECMTARDLLLHEEQQEDRLRDLERVLRLIRTRTTGSP